MLASRDHASTCARVRRCCSCTRSRLGKSKHILVQMWELELSRGEKEEQNGEQGSLEQHVQSGSSTMRRSPRVRLSSSQEVKHLGRAGEERAGGAADGG